MNKRQFVTAGLLATLTLLLVVSANESSAATSSPASSTPSTSSSSSSSHKTTTATQARQSPMSAAASIIGALGSLVPGLVSNIAPLVLLFGVGALMMPTLGLSAMGLLRESRRSATDPQMANLAAGLPVGVANPFGGYAARPLQTTPQDIYYFTRRSLPASFMPNINSQQLVAGLSDLLERTVRAIENADKRYN